MNTEITKTLADLTRGEKSLLLYFETVCVDYTGLIDPLKINKEEHDIAQKWHKEGFVEFGRVYSKDIEKLRGKSLFVILSENAWALAHEERKSKAIRTIANRTWLKSTESQLLTHESL